LRRACFAACVLALTLARPADAQPKKEQARAIYAKGKAAYERAEYPEALAYFEQAYRLSATPALLFNMAQAHRLSGTDHCQQALELYRKYLAEDPEAKNRDEAGERIEEMQSCVTHEQAAANSASVTRSEPAQANVSDPPAAASALPEPRPPAPAPSRVRMDRRPVSKRGRPAGAIVVTGVSAALGVAGIILYARARAKYDEVERTCPCAPGSFSDWETLTTVSYGLMAAGVTGTAAGVSWYLLGGASDGNPSRGVVIQGTVRF